MYVNMNMNVHARMYVCMYVCVIWGLDGYLVVLLADTNQGQGNANSLGQGPLRTLWLLDQTKGEEQLCDKS